MKEIVCAGFGGQGCVNRRPDFYPMWLSIAVKNTTWMPSMVQRCAGAPQTVQ